jgi:hypothetical protein
VSAQGDKVKADVEPTYAPGARVQVFNIGSVPKYDNTYGTLVTPRGKGKDGWIVMMDVDGSEQKLKEKNLRLVTPEEQAKMDA